MATASDIAPSKHATFETPEVLAMVVLVVATLAKTIASQGAAAYILPGLVYLGLLVAVMLRVPASSSARRAALAALLALGTWSMAASHNETLLMTISLLPVAALFEGMGLAVIAALLLCAATAAVSAEHGDPLQDRVQWVASVVGGDVFLLAFSRLLLRERQAQVALRRQASLERELSAAAERSRIAADLHDGLGHHLSAALIQIEAARAVGGSAPESAKAFIDRARALICGAMAEVRLAITVSRAHVGNRPFLAALEDLVRDSSDAGIPTRLVGAQGALTADELPPTTQYALWRGAQEALTNVRRHAGAKGATVTVAVEATALVLTIRDDGRGIDTLIEGTGLRSMRDRIDGAGGTVRVDSAPGAGCTVTLQVPR